MTYISKSFVSNNSYLIFRFGYDYVIQMIYVTQKYFKGICDFIAFNCLKLVKNDSRKVRLKSEHLQFKIIHGNVTKQEISKYPLYLQKIYKNISNTGNKYQVLLSIEISKSYHIS